MFINFIRRIELALIAVVDLPISAIDWSSSKARRGLRSLQDKIRKAI